MRRTLGLGDRGCAGVVAAVLMALVVGLPAPGTGPWPGKALSHNADLGGRTLLASRLGSKRVRSREGRSSVSAPFGILSESLASSSPLMQQLMGSFRHDDETFALSGGGGGVRASRNSVPQQQASNRRMDDSKDSSPKALSRTLPDEEELEKDQAKAVAGQKVRVKATTTERPSWRKRKAVVPQAMDEMMLTLADSKEPPEMLCTKGDNCMTSSSRQQLKMKVRLRNQVLQQAKAAVGDGKKNTSRIGGNGKVVVAAKRRSSQIRDEETNLEDFNRQGPQIPLEGTRTSFREDFTTLQNPVGLQRLRSRQPLPSKVTEEDNVGGPAASQSDPGEEPFPAEDEDEDDDEEAHPEVSIEDEGGSTSSGPPAASLESLAKMTLQELHDKVMAKAKEMQELPAAPPSPDKAETPKSIVNMVVEMAKEMGADQEAPISHGDAEVIRDVISQMGGQLSAQQVKAVSRVAEALGPALGPQELDIVATVADSIDEDTTDVAIDAIADVAGKLASEEKLSGSEVKAVVEVVQEAARTGDSTEASAAQQAVLDNIVAAANAQQDLQAGDLADLKQAVMDEQTDIEAEVAGAIAEMAGSLEKQMSVQELETVVSAIRDKVEENPEQVLTLSDGKEVAETVAAVAGIDVTPADAMVMSHIVEMLGPEVSQSELQIVATLSGGIKEAAVKNEALTAEVGQILEDNRDGSKESVKQEIAEAVMLKDRSLTAEQADLVAELAVAASGPTGSHKLEPGVLAEIKEVAKDPDNKLTSDMVETLSTLLTPLTTPVNESEVEMIATMQQSFPSHLSMGSVITMLQEHGSELSTADVAILTDIVIALGPAGVSKSEMKAISIISSSKQQKQPTEEDSNLLVTDDAAHQVVMAVKDKGVVISQHEEADIRDTLMKEVMNEEAISKPATLEAVVEILKELAPVLDEEKVKTAVKVTLDAASDGQEADAGGDALEVEEVKMIAEKVSSLDKPVSKEQVKAVAEKLVEMGLAAKASGSEKTISPEEAEEVAAAAVVQVSSHDVSVIAEIAEAIGGPDQVVAKDGLVALLSEKVQKKLTMDQATEVAQQVKIVSSESGRDPALVITMTVMIVSQDINHEEAKIMEVILKESADDARQPNAKEIQDASEVAIKVAKDLDSKRAGDLVQLATELEEPATPEKLELVAKMADKMGPDLSVRELNLIQKTAQNAGLDMSIKDVGTLSEIVVSTPEVLSNDGVAHLVQKVSAGGAPKDDDLSLQDAKAIANTVASMGAIISDGESRKVTEAFLNAKPTLSEDSAEMMTTVLTQLLTSSSASTTVDSEMVLMVDELVEAVSEQGGLTKGELDEVNRVVKKLSKGVSPEVILSLSGLVSEMGPVISRREFNQIINRVSDLDNQLTKKDVNFLCKLVVALGSQRLTEAEANLVSMLSKSLVTQPTLPVVGAEGSAGEIAEAVRAMGPSISVEEQDHLKEMLMKPEGISEKEADLAAQIIADIKPEVVDTDLVVAITEVAKEVASTTTKGDVETLKDIMSSRKAEKLLSVEEVTPEAVAFVDRMVSGRGVDDPELVSALAKNSGISISAEDARAISEAVKSLGGGGLTSGEAELISIMSKSAGGGSEEQQLNNSDNSGFGLKDRQQRPNAALTSPKAAVGGAADGGKVRRGPGSPSGALRMKVRNKEKLAEFVRQQQDLNLGTGYEVPASSVPVTPDPAPGPPSPGDIAFLEAYKSRKRLPTGTSGSGPGGRTPPPPAAADEVPTPPVPEPRPSRPFIRRKPALSDFPNFTTKSDLEMAAGRPAGGGPPSPPPGSAEAQQLDLMKFLMEFQTSPPPPAVVEAEAPSPPAQQEFSIAWPEELPGFDPEATSGVEFDPQRLPSSNIAGTGKLTKFPAVPWLHVSSDDDDDDEDTALVPQPPVPKVEVEAAVTPQSVIPELNSPIPPSGPEDLLEDLPEDPEAGGASVEEEAPLVPMVFNAPPVPAAGDPAIVRPQLRPLPTGNFAEFNLRGNRYQPPVGEASQRQSLLNELSKKTISLDGGAGKNFMAITFGQPAAPSGSAGVEALPGLLQEPRDAVGQQNLILDNEDWGQEMVAGEHPMVIRQAVRQPLNPPQTTNLRNHAKKPVGADPSGSQAGRPSPQPLGIAAGGSFGASPKKPAEVNEAKSGQQKFNLDSFTKGNFASVNLGKPALKHLASQRKPGGAPLRNSLPEHDVVLKDPFERDNFFQGVAGPSSVNRDVAPIVKEILTPATEGQRPPSSLKDLDEGYQGVVGERYPFFHDDRPEAPAGTQPAILRPTSLLHRSNLEDKRPTAQHDRGTRPKANNHLPGFPTFEDGMRMVLKDSSPGFQNSKQGPKTRSPPAASVGAEAIFGNLKFRLPEEGEPFPDIPFSELELFDEAHGGQEEEDYGHTYDRPLDQIFRDLPNVHYKPKVPDVEGKNEENLAKAYLQNPFGSDFVRLEVDPDRYSHNKTLGIRHVPLKVAGYVPTTELVGPSSPPSPAPLHKRPVFLQATPAGGPPGLAGTLPTKLNLKLNLPKQRLRKKQQQKSSKVKSKLTAAAAGSSPAAAGPVRIVDLTQIQNLMKGAVDTMENLPNLMHSLVSNPASVFGGRAFPDGVGATGGGLDETVQRGVLSSSTEASTETTPSAATEVTDTSS